MKLMIGAAGVLGVWSGAAGQVAFAWCEGATSGGWLSVEGVAPGGGAVVGTASFPGTSERAYRWTPATGIVNLGALPSPVVAPYSNAYGVSADGQVVVGSTYTSGDRGFRWQNGVMTELPILPGGTSASARHISADGSVVLGSCVVSGESRVVRWTAAGIEDLGRPPWRTRAGIRGVSGDGAVIAGVAYTAFGQDDTAFVYEGGEWTDLGLLPGTLRSFATAVSADGRVVVGTSENPVPSDRHGFVWTREGGMRLLAPPAGVWGLQARSVSGDGSVIVGGLRKPFTPDPDGFVWTRWDGGWECGPLLRGMGVNLDGWTAVVPWVVTPDGRTLAGTAKSGATYKAWIATMPEGFGCYANCDGSTAAPVLNVNDFVCFQNRFGAGDTGANCDGSTVDPVLNVNDFICFVGEFAAGCS